MEKEERREREGKEKGDGKKRGRKGEGGKKEEERGRGFDEKNYLLDRVVSN